MSAGVAFSTKGALPADRTEEWTAAVSRSYFPLDLSYRRPEAFSGQLRTWGLGQVQASRLCSEPALYRRRRAHLRDQGDEDFLLTIPRKSPVRFLQMGREVECAPGGFILERGNEPYVFSYGAANELIVAKIAARHLEARLPDPGRFCAVCFDSGHGVGGLLHDLLLASETRAPELTVDGDTLVGRQVIDLLALAIEADPRAALSQETGVRRAHLRRIDASIARRFCEQKLGPAEIAAACGISVRYLHDLCRGDGASFGERLRMARLAAVREALLRKDRHLTITQIAMAAGFSDMSAFSRLYRQTFDETPRDTRIRVLRHANETGAAQPAARAPGGAGVCGIRKMPRK